MNFRVLSDMFNSDTVGCIALTCHIVLNGIFYLILFDFVLVG